MGAQANIGFKRLLKISTVRRGAKRAKNDR